MKSELIRAARGALDWSQTELAERADVHFQTIVSIEKGASTPSSATLNKIRQAFERNGLEIEGDSIKIGKKVTYEFSGKDWYVDLLNDVSETLKNDKNPEWLCMFVNESVSPQHIIDKIKDMRASGIKMRSLIEEGDTHIMGPLSEYRTVPKSYFLNEVILIYGSKVAISLGNSNKVIVFNDARLRNTFLNQFQYNWDNGGTPSVSRAASRY